jgi:bifunctional non-homologous end joining protein LigD
MLATAAGALPRDEQGWSYELKWDGYRAIAFLDRGRLRLLSRRQQDYTARVPELAGLANAHRRSRLILDGELVAIVEGGRASFQALQHRMAPQFGARLPPESVPPSVIAFIVFDLLYVDGRSLLSVPYADRRTLLEDRQLSGPAWWVPPSEGSGMSALEQSRALGMEGVVAKRLDSPYRPGIRSGEWLKVKGARRQEFVIAGWTPSDSHPDRLAALVLAYYRSGDGGEQRLVYAGRVGSGLSQRSVQQLEQLLGPLRADRSPLDSGDMPPNAVWVRPVLVCEVAFREWSWGGELRHPSFMGLRPDVEPRDVTREEDEA